MVRNQFCKDRFGSESSGVAVDWFTICFASDSAAMGVVASQSILATVAEGLCNSLAATPWMN